MVLLKKKVPILYFGNVTEENRYKHKNWEGLIYILNWLTL
jgi:hypothetical protein